MRGFEPLSVQIGVLFSSLLLVMGVGDKCGVCMVRFLLLLLRSWVLIRVGLLHQTFRSKWAKSGRLVFIFWGVRKVNDFRMKKQENKNQKLVVALI